MVKTSFGSYEQFKEFFRKAPRNVQNILYKAYPQWARQLTEEYIAATKKISASKVKPEVVKETPKLTMAKDTVKGVNKATQTVSKGLGFLNKVPKGAVGLVGKAFAPIQGVANIISPNADIQDKATGVGMVGTGTAALFGVPYTAPVAAGLVGVDTLKKYVMPPLGRMIGEKLYGTGDQYGNDGGLADPYNYEGTSLKTNLTPEQTAKITAYNKAQLNKVQAQADASLARGQAEIDAYNKLINGNQEIQNQIENDIRGGEYPQAPTGFGFASQKAQDAQEGGLNEIQDNLYSEPYKPSLKPIVEPVNYSNEYLASQNNLINQLQQNANQGEQAQMNMNNVPDMSQMRPYAQIDNQPQGLDYGAILQQYNDAIKADQRQNQVNQMINAFGVFGTPSSRAPISYVGYDGKLKQIELDQPNQVEALPTNTTSNYDKLMGQLKIQQAQQADTIARQQQAAADLKAQQEYIANQNMMNALGQHLNVDPNMFANPDIAKAALQYVFNPNIQARANVQEAIDKAPTQAMLKAAEQRGATAGKLDEIQLQSQYDAMLANINNNAKLEAEAMVQGGMDRRMAAQLATQRAIAQSSQLQQNYRAMLEDQRARDLAEYGRGTQESVANIYAGARQSGSEKPSLTLGEQIYLESVKSGTPIPQALKYAQIVDPNFGLSQAEQAELNRR